MEGTTEATVALLLVNLLLLPLITGAIMAMVAMEVVTGAAMPRLHSVRALLESFRSKTYPNV